MQENPIPKWNIDRILPPVNEVDPAFHTRSPYNGGCG